MSQLVKLTVTNRGKSPNPDPLKGGPQSYGFDVEDIVSPIIRNTSLGKSYFTTRTNKGLANNDPNGSKIDYMVSETLSDIVSRSSKFLILNVVSRRGASIGKEYIFVSSKISEDFVEVASGTLFYYIEDGDPLPVEYIVSESIDDIISQQNASINSDIHNVKYYGATGDGVTDDTESIQLAVDSQDYIYFPDGVYLSDNIVLTRDNTIEGLSKNAIIKAIPSMTGYLINADGYSLSISSIKIQGDNPINYSPVAGSGTQSGIFLNILSPKQIVEDVDFIGFDNLAIGLNGNILHDGDGLVIDSCSFLYCSVGIDTGPGGANRDQRLNGTNGAEYISIVNNIFKYCRYGYIADSGNQTATGNVMSDNYYGFYINGAAANSGHSSFVGNISNSNQFNLFAKDCGIGYSITGNQFFSGNLTLENCVGIVITNNTFGGVSTIRFYLGSGNTFAYNWFYTNPTIQNLSLLGTEIHSNYIVGNGYMSNRSPLIVDITGTESSGVPTGPELVTNGVFAADTDWVKQAGWTISAGTANGAATNGYLYQALGATIFGANLVVTYTISNYVSGSINFSIGGGSQSKSRNANGTYTESVIGGIGGGTEIYFLGNNFTGSIDDVSVKVGNFTPLPIGNFTGGHFKAAKLSRTSLPPVYANNAAAIAGGLVLGEEYRSGADPDVLCIVH